MFTKFFLSDMKFSSHWENISTVKPVYTDKPWDPKKVASVEKWSLFMGQLYYKSLKRDLKGGRYRHVVAIQRWSLAKV